MNFTIGALTPSTATDSCHMMSPNTNTDMSHYSVQEWLITSVWVQEMANTKVKQWLTTKQIYMECLRKPIPTDITALYYEKCASSWKYKEEQFLEHLTFQMNEIGRYVKVWKMAVMVYLKRLFQHSPRKTWDNQENLSQNSWYHAEIQTRLTPGYRFRILSLYQPPLVGMWRIQNTLEDTQQISIIFVTDTTSSIQQTYKTIQ